MLTQLRDSARQAVATRQRNARCRRDGHTWTEMANPPACTLCGRTRSDGDGFDPDGPPIAA